MISTHDKNTLNNFLSRKPTTNVWLKLFDDDLLMCARCGTRSVTGAPIDFIILSGLTFSVGIDERSIIADLLNYLDPNYNILIEGVDLAPILLLVTERGYETGVGANFTDIDAQSIVDPNFKWDDPPFDYNAAYERAIKVL